MRSTLTITGAVLTILIAWQRAPSGADALQTLVETERQFALTAEAKGIRDSFLAFFSEDAIALTPEPRSAVARLVARPSVPYAEAALAWEPRAGNVSASGELGWLTGPSTYFDHKNHAGARFGNYLSIWRKQRDGQWRVYLDIGTSVPQPAPFPREFWTVRLKEPYVRGTSPLGTVTLADVDRSMNTQVGQDGMARTYATVLASSGSRLHRQNTMPQVGRSAIVSWLEKHSGRWAFQTAAAQVATSEDLGYSYGSYAAGQYHGAYARVWSRDAQGRWWLIAEVTTEE